MGGTLDPKEREYLAEVKRRSKKAFDGATRLLRNDTRWHLIQAQAERAVPRVIFHDEFRSSVIGDQLVMYIPESLLDAARLPDRAILYVWSNVFSSNHDTEFFLGLHQSDQVLSRIFPPGRSRSGPLKKGSDNSGVHR
jgi:hypothetical protein